MRDENHRLVTDHTFHLELHDFIPPTSRGDGLENLDLVFDSLKLANMVHEALNMQGGGGIEDTSTSIAPEETQPLPSPIQSASPQPTTSSAPLASGSQTPSLGTETAQPNTAATPRTGWLSMGRLRRRRGR